MHSDTSGDAAEISQVTVRIDRVTRLLALLALVVILLGIGREIVVIAVGAQTDRFGWKVFGLDGEANLPTTYNALLLLACTAIILFIAHHARRTEPRNAQAWTWLGWGFLYLTIDEAVQLHEAINLPLHALHEWTGVLGFPWVIVAVPVLAVVFAAFLPFLHRLHRPTAIRLVVAGTIYLLGAVGMEIVAAQVIEMTGRGPWYALCFIIEETGELAGATLAIRALLLHLAETSGMLRVSLVAGGSGANR